jgi:signal transduction histidine kinase
MKHQLDVLNSEDLSTELVAMLAHDLRGSVTTIKGFSQLALRQCPPPPPLSVYLEAVVSESNRVAALIDDLVLVSELEDEPELIRAVPIRLSALLSMAVERSQALYASRQIVVEPIGAESVAWCDRSLTEHALARLLSTLLRYCSDRQPVRISTARESEGLLIGLESSSETASSRLPALKRALVDRASSRGEGLNASGLGLYIGRRLIERQGGRVWIEQSLESGVRLVVMLPEHRQVPSSRR